MKIAIIGAGNVGGALAKTFSRAGHSVVIADRDPEEAGQLAAQVGGTGTADLGRAASQAEVVVLAVPFAASAEQVSKAIAGQVKGKIVIDATNPLKPDFSGLATEGGPSGAERIQQWLPSARVVKAFNTVFASNQAEPVVEGEPVDGLVAADDEQARKTVLGLLADIGFRPIDVGPLARARARGSRWFASKNFWEASPMARRQGDPEPERREGPGPHGPGRGPDESPERRKEGPLDPWRVPDLPGPGYGPGTHGPGRGPDQT